MNMFLRWQVLSVNKMFLQWLVFLASPKCLSLSVENRGRTTIIIRKHFNENSRRNLRDHGASDKIFQDLINEDPTEFCNSMGMTEEKFNELLTIVWANYNKIRFIYEKGTICKN